MTYQEALEQVETAMQIGDETFYLALSFAGSKNNAEAYSILADAYHQAAEGVNNFNMTVIEYVMARLDDMEHLKAADAFESEEAANVDGYYWFDELHAWLKVDHFNN